MVMVWVDWRHAMFGIGTTELVIILAIAIFVFGASRLPALGKGLGSGMRNFRDAIKGVSEEDAADGGKLDKKKKDGGDAEDV